MKVVTIADLFAVAMISIFLCPSALADKGGPGKLLTSHGKLTYYSAPTESDFGTPALGTDHVSYEGPDGKTHRGKFVRGFTSRYSTDPMNEGLSGVAMEG